jgi:uncharacterized damage-inducible protein DinB
LLLMSVDDLKRRYDYSYWANAKLFAAMRQLTAEQFTQNVAGSYGSIRNTLVHAMSAEWGWIARCGGPARGPQLKGEDYPALDDVVDQWAIVEGYAREFLGTLRDEDLERIVTYDIPPVAKGAGSIAEFLEHGINHTVHHRGQIALLMRALGAAPGNVDLLFYDAEKRAARA